MALLSKEQITAADDRQWEDVDVPEWGGTVRLLGMSGTERNAYQASLVVLGPNGSVQRMNMQDQLAKLLAKCLVGEDFERLFSDKEVKALGAKNGAVLERLGKIAQRLSGLRKEDMEAAEGKSETTASGVSTTD
ncbi:hypothetical protein DKG34_10960 [Streptomyces sp. NWU49]|uniref:hypothetical protein n=1 Tax=Streptomyces sp. NWU49 TaxID=2201153 RepID=UPI000D6803AF|nr:hypothetical protein [Streptomyces sp. NWU49]PWJ07916.1 hypothetical protein DKG34_10960 [Streptomyces sp. NWU49]